MKNNKKAKINTAITGFSVLILLLIFILAFQPVITADGGRRKMNIGDMAGYILSNAARVDEDEEDELEEAVEELEDYENLTLISELQIIIQYAKYSSSIYNDYIENFITHFIFVTLVFVMEVLLVVVVFCQILRTILDLIKKDCEIADVCKRMSTILGIWILSVMAGISFYEYCDIWGFPIDIEFGFAFSVIGILAIIMCVICMLASVAADKALGKQLQPRLITLVLFFTAVFGIYSLKADAFKIEYSVEESGYEYIDNNYKFSFASLPEWEVLQTIDSIQVINNEVDYEDTSNYIGKITNSAIALVAGFGCVILLVVTYSISIGNFAAGMCGRRYSLILQIICSLFSIGFIILTAVLLSIGTNQMADTMEKVYKNIFFDSVSCEFHIKYRMGYFIPFIVNILFIALSIVKKVLDRKLPVNNFYPQSISYPENMPYMTYSQGEMSGQEAAYTREGYPQQVSQSRNICPSCGAENEAGNRFCSKCGQQIQTKC